MTGDYREMEKILGALEKRERLLLHSCCAPCSTHAIKLLKQYFDLTVFYFNPNIFPQEEFDRRLNELIKYAKKKDVKLIIEKQNSEDWYNAIAGLENEPEKGKRCLRCFEYRLLYTVLKAFKLEYEYFTTTLTVSPHKNSKTIFQIANELARKYELTFLDIDFKKENGFLKTMQIAKQENFYRQNYCGCEFSMFH